jgi:hypothetical protein
MGLPKTKQTINDNLDEKTLGQKIDHFPIRHQLFNRWLLVIIGIILLVDGSLCALINIFNLWNAIQSHGRAVLLAKITEPAIAVFIILPLGILLIILAAVNWQNGLTLFEEGLVIKKRKLEKVWLWEVIERFDNHITLVKFSGTTLTSRRKIILEDKQQNTLRLKNKYERMDELVTQLRKHILPELINGKLEHLQNGGKIQFHEDITALRQGLRIKGKFFAWHELQISVDKKGIVRVIQSTDQRELFKSKTNQIKNLDVLVHLVNNPPNHTI